MVRRIFLTIALVVTVLAVAGAAVAAVGIGTPSPAGDGVDVLGDIDSSESTEVVVATRARVLAPEDRSDESPVAPSSTTTKPMESSEGQQRPSAAPPTTMGYDDHLEAPEAGIIVIDVSPAGSITVEVRDGYLYLTEIDIDPKWMPHKRDEKADEFELGFYWGESELKIKVELDDGHLKKMIEFDIKKDQQEDGHGSTTTTTRASSDDADAPRDGVTVIDVSPAGSITVEVRDGYLYLTDIDIDPKWMPHKRDEKADEFELGFYWGESELKIKVELEDGHLKKMIEFDIKE